MAVHRGMASPFGAPQQAVYQRLHTDPGQSQFVRNEFPVVSVDTSSWNRSDGNLDSTWNLSPVGDWNQKTENGSASSFTHSLAHELTAVDGQAINSAANGSRLNDVDGRQYVWHSILKFKFWIWGANAMTKQPSRARRYASMSFATTPCTSVSRKSRPA